MPKGQERITNAEASFDSPVGIIVSQWDMVESFVYQTSLPQNANATLYLPLFGQTEYTQNGERRHADTLQSGCAVIPLGEGHTVEVPLQ